MERTELPIAEGPDGDREAPDEFFDVANLFPKHTGLPFVVWISYRGGARHDIRVKVSQAFDKPRRACAILIEVSRAAFCSRATIASMGSPAGGRPRGSDGYDAVLGMG
jgi:hypothetical protein